MEKKYKHFFNFAGAWFADSDFEEKTEAEIVNEFKKTISAEKLCTIILEAIAVKSQINEYWTEVSKETNIYFSNEHEAEIWLDELIKFLRQP